MKWNHKGYLCLAGAIVGTLVVAAGSALLPPVTLAETSETETTTQSGNVMTTPTQASASRIFVNPETGEIGGPTPAQAAALSQTTADATSRSDKGLVIVRHKDGAESVNLMGRFQHAAVATSTEDGVHTDCVTGSDHADHAHTAEAE